MLNILRISIISLCVGLFLSMINVGSAMAVETNAQVVKPGSVIIEEDVYDAFDDEPSAYFYNAHENFMRKDLKGAARELRKAAAFIKLESGRATEEGKLLLVSSYNELGKLANDVEKGTITSVKDFEAAFARAHQALAKHHYLMAIEAQTKKEVGRAGHFMQSALVHLEHGFAWSGHKLEAAAVESFHGIRVLSGKLIEGAGWIPEEIGKAITWIGDEIKLLGSKIE